MQHEREPLGWRQLVQHDHERRPDRVGDLHVVRWVVVHGGLHDLMHAHTVVALALTDHVECDPGDHGGEPSREVLDVCGLGPGESQPRFLHGVLGVGFGPQESPGHTSQSGPLDVEEQVELDPRHVVLPRLPRERHHSDDPQHCRVTPGQLR